MPSIQNSSPLFTRNGGKRLAREKEAISINRVERAEVIRDVVAQWERQSNAEGARVEWLFYVRPAREMLARVYPSLCPSTSPEPPETVTITLQRC